MRSDDRDRRRRTMEEPRGRDRQARGRRRSRARRARRTSSRSAACSAPTTGRRPISASRPPRSRPGDPCCGARRTASGCCVRSRRRVRFRATSLRSSSQVIATWTGPAVASTRDLVEEKRLDALLYIGPNGALPEGLRDNPEIDALADHGLPVVQITGHDALTGATVNLMDPDARAHAVEPASTTGRRTRPTSPGCWDRRMATQPTSVASRSPFPTPSKSDDRFAFSVLNKGKAKGFVWVWMERVEEKKPRVPEQRGDRGPRVRTRRRRRCSSRRTPKSSSPSRTTTASPRCSYA